MRWNIRYVGLGIFCLIVSSACDNLRGPLLPLLAGRYSLSYARAAAFLTCASAASFLFSLASVRLLALLNDRGYLYWALGLQSAALLGSTFRSNYAFLLLCGMLWGAGNSGLGLVANLYAIRGSCEQTRARSLSTLHLFYGFSSILPALYVARCLSWRLSLAEILLIPLLLPASLALWASRVPCQAEEGLGQTWKWGELWDLSALALIFCIVFYVLGEVLTSMWMVSYLHGHAGLDLRSASRVLAGFFLAMGLSRVVTAVFSRPGLERILMPFCLISSCLCLGLGLSGRIGGFIGAAFLMGPVFPLMVAALSLDHPQRYRGLMPFMYACMTVALGAGHLAVGRLADIFSLHAAYHLPPACLLVSFLFYLLRDGRKAEQESRELGVAAAKLV